MSSSSNKKLELCRHYGEDRLSILPEELLIDIISLLPFKMAVKTSALSRRWRHLWKHIHTIHLKSHDFEASSPKWKLMETTRLKFVTHTETPEYIRSVCQLMPYFPRLKNLEIVAQSADPSFAYTEKKLWERLRFTFSSFLPQLKTAIIHVRIRTVIKTRKSFTAWYSINQITLVSILLSSSKTLEKLVVVAEAWDDVHIKELQLKLLGFEKASTTAEIVIRQEK